jgi:hypothetical protein
MFEHKGLVTATYVLLPYLAFESDRGCRCHAMTMLYNTLLVHLTPGPFIPPSPSAYGPRRNGAQTEILIGRKGASSPAPCLLTSLP